MQKTTFGPHIQYVILILLLIISSTGWNGTNLYAQQITANTVNPTCSDSSNGSINISVSGGTSPYTFSWNGPGVSNVTSEDLSNLNPGNYTLNVTDSNSGTATKSFELVVEDLTDPTITAPSARSAETSDDGNGNCTTTVSLGTPSTNDNCGVKSVLPFVDGQEINPNSYLFPIGVTTVTWVVTDVNNRTASKTQEITVVDNENPTITAPTAKSAKTSDDGNGNCTTTVALGNPSTNDNCGVKSVLPYVDSQEINPDNYSFPIGETTVTWIVTDENNRTASATQKVTVSDDEKPAITAPADVEEIADSNSCTASQVNLGTESTSDNCGIANITNDAPSAFPLGTTNVTWTVTDNSGNISTAVQKVTITDTTLPVISAGENITVTNDNGRCDASVNVTPASATDNCNVGNPSGTRDDGLALSDPYPVGETTITWNVTDANGNQATPVTQDIIVEDKEAPKLPEVEDIFWGCTYTVEAPVTTDNCSGEIVGTTTDNVTFSTTGNYQITWKFQDEYGNFSELVQNIEIDELVAEINQEDVACNGFQTGEATAVVSGGVAPYYYSWKKGTTEIGSSETVSNLEAGTYSLVVTDVNGCSLEKTVTITEPEALQMSAPQSTAVSCFGGNDGSIITGTVTGGTAPYQYSIDNTNFQDNNTFANLTASNYTIFVTDANNCSLQVDVAVDQPEILEADLSKTDVKCFEGEDGTIIVSNSSGGTSGYEYSLDEINWQSSPEFTGLTANSYTVYMRDATVTGCSVSLGSVTLNQPTSKITATVTATRTTSYGSATGSVSADPSGGTPGYFYKWTRTGDENFSKATKTVNNLPAGEYNVVVSDANGCETETLSVTILETVFAQIESAAFCESEAKKGQNPIRTAYFRVSDFTAIGGDGTYTYKWEFGEGKTATGPGEHGIVYSAPGNKNIKLTVTDGSGQQVVITRQQYVGLCYEPCGQAQNFQFDVNGIYIGDINGNKLNLDDPTVCASGIAMYLFLPVSKSVNVYNPYTEVTFITSDGSAAEEVFETQSDFGCKDGDLIDEQPVDKDIKENKVGDFIRLTQNAIEYSCGDDLKIDSFYITYTNVSKKDCGSNNNGFCYSTNEPVTVPTPVYINAVTEKILCKGDDSGIIRVTGSGGFAPYTFDLEGDDRGFENIDFFNGLKGDVPYTIYVKDARGNTNSTTVTISQPESAVSLEITSENPKCFGEIGSAQAIPVGGTPFVRANGDKYYEIFWNNVDSNTTVEVESSESSDVELEPGNYTVTVEDANGCQSIAEVIITEPAQLSIPEAGDDITLGCGNLSTILNANIPESGVGKWTIDTANSSAGGTFSSDLDASAVFTGSAGTYTLIWTISNEDGSCDDYDTVMVTLEGECSKLDFDGVDDHITFGDSYGFNSGYFSFEIWVKPESVSGVQTIFSKRDKSNPATGYELIINNGAPTFRWNGKSVSTSSKISTTRWHHIAVVYNGSTRLYIDGIDVGNATGSNPGSNTSPFLLGAVYDTATPKNPKNFYSGWMEEFRVWKIALTQEQIQFMMNQKIVNNNDLVKGEVLPMNVPGNIAWTSLSGYYKLNPAEISAGKTFDISASPVSGELKNIETNQYQSAPLPYISDNDGSWRSRETWDANIGTAQERWWDVPNGKGINNSNINWNIVRAKHAISSASTDVYLLGLLSESNTITMEGNVSSQTGNAMTVTKYLKLDGVLDLDGESQLIQTEGSILAEESSGYLERDQQGTENSFNYNYWTSPVSRQGQANNSGFSLSSVLHDGSTPETPAAINFNYQYHWADNNYTGALRISSYWLYSFQGTANDYFQWSQFSENDILQPGIGYSMKGSRGSAAVSSLQNYTFRGKPNNGNISVSVGKDQNLLTGNPYPSALDAQKFIQDNIQSFNGTIYLWDHFGAEYSHYLEEYIGGYAAFNLSGGIASASSIDSRINATNDKSQKSPPGKYIPVGQAFFINTKGVSNPTKITYKNAHRAFVSESSSDSQFHMQEDGKKKNKENEYEKDSRFKIRLKLESPKGYHRQILLTADGNTTDGFDLGYDAPLIENNVEDMYWLIDETEFVIQGVPDFNSNRILPIGFKIAEAGSYTIKVDEFENLKSDFNVYLKDLENEEYFNLSESDYTVTTEETGVFNEKYQIVFRKPGKVIPEEPEVEEDRILLDMNYLRDSDEISLYNPDLTNIDFVELYSISGQKIMTFHNVPTEESVLLRIQQKLSSAVYIVKVYSGEKAYSKKVIISK